MIKNSSYRSGFVYGAKHPENENLIKIGFTRKSPISRIKELGKTSNISDFILIDARWVFDCLYCERKVHDKMVQNQIPKEKEFFIVCESEIKNLFDWMEKIDDEKQREILKNNKDRVDLDNGDDIFLSWFEDDLSHRFNYVKNEGIKNMEKMASKGWGVACFNLAENYIKKEKVTKNRWIVADCLYRAGEKQGEGGGRLRSMFWKSFWDESILDEYFSLLWSERERKNLGHRIFDLCQETLEDEANLQREVFERAKLWNEWLDKNSLIKLKRNHKI